MRKALTLAIEIISITTALGVVVSAFIYSLQFAAIGLSYMAFASLSDMLRDSIKLLILFLAAAVGMAVPLLFITLTHNGTKTIGGRVGLSIIFLMLVGSVVALMIYAAAAVAGGVTTTPYSKNFSVVVLLLIAMSFIAFMAYTYGPQRSLLSIVGAAAKSISSPASSVLLLAIFSCVVVYPVYHASRLIMKQLENGLPMNVEIGDVKACESRRSYTTIWLGDSKAVVRCKDPEIYVVKVVN